MKKDSIALGIEIHGIVQGVGFRPFVYQLAEAFGLKGTVANTTTGVSIHVEGPTEAIEAFRDRLTGSPPPLARVTEITLQPQTFRHHESFSILPSIDRAEAATIIPPDSSVCNDCLREMRDPSNRRFRYPFINCTHCGPRYTIIEDIPYDRPNTTMKRFSMCGKCESEYKTPSDRRFHAQPTACPECGPRVTLYDNRRNQIETADPVTSAVSLLKAGHILAVKGLGGFHLAADAESDPAITALRHRKGRPHKPFALMSGSIETVERYAHITPEEAMLLCSPERPIVLLEKRPVHLLSEQVAPGNSHFGVMLPYTPLHDLLLENEFTALVMTSGNRSDTPLCIDNEDAFERLSDIADFFLLHDRPIHQRNDDTLIRPADGKPRFIRRARGTVPVPIQLGNPVPPTLACGAELKNTICLAMGNRAFVSQHLGDMGDLSVFEFFKDTIVHLKKVTRITPEIVAHDLHPDYLGTRYALALDGVTRTGVQHHHAHIVSCMAENLILEPVIGLALDGTGYGTDGAVWGGEVILADLAGFTRMAHPSYVPMPGGEAAIREPWRMAVSYLYRAFGEDIGLSELPLLKGIEPSKWKGVLEMISKRLRSPDTSSIGRLFDGMAAMMGLHHRVTFEGQAAMALETCAGPRLFRAEGAYDWEIQTSGTPMEIDFTPLIRQVASDIRNRKDPGVISRKFHQTLIRLFGDICVSVRDITGINRVALSGGVFQNRLLLEGLTAILKERRFEVFSHTLLPTNDGGISLGQAVAAAAINQTREVQPVGI